MTSPLAPIGIFDSGVGGLTVLRALRQRFPQESFIYLGDTARVPYGSKSPSTVSRYSLNIADFLMQEGCRAIVIACNTASAYAAETLRETFSVPVIDVIQPMAAYVAQHATSQVLVLGTRGTVQSAAYVKALQQRAPHLRVSQQACPLFVPLVEEGWTHGSVPTEVIDTYLREAFADGVPDHIILGCTHYPLMRPLIEERVRVLAPGQSIAIVDSGLPTVEEITQRLALRRPAAYGSSMATTMRYLVTDAPEAFVPLAERFLGENVETAEHVDIPMKSISSSR